MIPNFLGALAGVLAGHGAWHGCLWWMRRREAKRAPISAELVFADPEQVFCRRCDHDHAVRISVGLSAGDAEGGPIGWFTMCTCESPVDVMRRHSELVSVLQEGIDEFLGAYTQQHRRPKADKAAVALIDHMVTAAKQHSDE